MNSKIQSLLVENEQVVALGRIHWIVLVMPAIYLIIALTIGIMLHPIIGGVILFVSLYPLYNAVIHYWMTYLVLTDRKVMSREGFISREWVRMEFDRIENSHLEEPIIGRILGYSTVSVSGVGSGAITIRYVANGDKFMKALEEMLSQESAKDKVK